MNYALLDLFGKNEKDLRAPPNFRGVLSKLSQDKRDTMANVAKVAPTPQQLQ